MDELITLHGDQLMKATTAIREEMSSSGASTLGASMEGLRNLSSVAMNACVSNWDGALLACTGSSVDSVPLPLQLLTQPRLTVDLTLQALRDGSHLGVSLEDLGRLAQAGFIYMNLRDYDSDLERNDLRGHREHREALLRLLETADGAIYLSSAIRKPIFDAADALRTETALNHGNYTAHKALAAEALRDVGARYQKLPPGSSEIVRFRGRPVTIDATLWHCAFINAARNAIPEQSFDLFRGHYETAAQTQTLENLARLMRIARTLHLSHTAPLTASFGTYYNMMDSEYAEAAFLALDASNNENLDHDAMTQEFLYYLFVDGVNRANAIGRLRVDLATDPAAQIFSQASITSIMNVLRMQREPLQTIGAEFKAFYAACLAEPGGVPDLQEVIRKYHDVQAQTALFLAAEDSWSNWLRVGGHVACSLVSGFPGLVALLSAASVFSPKLAKVLTGTRLSPLNRMLHRVHKLAR